MAASSMRFALVGNGCEPTSSASLLMSPHHPCLLGIILSGFAIRAVGPSLLAARQSRQACSALAPHRRLAASVSSSVPLELTSRRRPDSYESPSLSSYHHACIPASGGITLSIPEVRSHVRRLPRPTALPARSFSHGCFPAIAGQPPLQKPPSRFFKAYASAYCRKRPISPARRESP